jgi:predicted nucleotidyltransferase
MAKQTSKSAEAAISDATARIALEKLKRRLRRRFGDRLQRLVLFGSRARGDHRPESDADVAVVLRGRLADPWATKAAVIEDTYDILLETGLYVQPWPISASALQRPHSAANPHLARAIARDGKTL